MSLSLRLSQGGTPIAAGGPASAVPPSPSSQSSQRSSQRASAATRARRAAAANANASSAAAAAASPEPAPAANAAATATASELQVIPPSPSPTEPSLTQTGGSRPSRGRQSAAAAAPTASVLPSALPDHLSPSPSPPAPATVASSRRSAAVAVPPPIRSKPVVVDDGSSSFLSKFTFGPVEGPPREPGGTFHVWVHYAPVGDSLQVILVQATGLYRAYTFNGHLMGLRPAGLYMSGMKDKDYRAYVLDGLCEQDTKDNYEYELITADDMDDEDSPAMEEDDGTPKIRAQLKIYKQMGSSTRVPVCIAHIRFEAMRLSSSPLSPPDRPRQDEQQYRESTSLLISSLVSWVNRLRARRNAHEVTIARQAQECKVAEELEHLPPNGDLPASGRDLISRMLGMLNDKKAIIRQRREEYALLEQECFALRPRVRGRPKADAEEVSSASSSSEDEGAHDQDSEDEVRAIDEEKHVGAEVVAAAVEEDDGGVRAMELDEPSPPVPAASAFGPSADSIPFPDSIEPVSMGSISASFGLSPSLTSPPQSSSRSSRHSQPAVAGAAPSPAPSSSFGNGDLDLSPPRTKALVRKRARPAAIPLSPSQLPSPSSFPSQVYHEASRASVTQTIGLPRGIARQEAAPPAGTRPPSRADASQMIREMASNAPSRKAQQSAPPSAPPSASPEPPNGSKKPRRTSRFLGELE